MAHVCLVLLLGLGMISAPAAQSDTYVLGARDVLAITVWNQLDLSGRFVIDATGAITFPLVGRVEAAGLTVEEVKTKLLSLLADGIYNEPQLSVSVDEYQSQRVFIVGEVRAPGSYPLSGETTVIEALAVAGSTTAEASGELLVVRRPPDASGSGPVLPNQETAGEIIRVDLAALRRGELPNTLSLQDGDTMFVPRAESVFVFGQVTRPGSYPIDRTTTVMHALALAGGVSDRGAANRTKILRMTDGREQQIDVELSDPVQPGDTIVVPERYF